jgi:predicted nucleic acid-binding protein
VKRYILETGRAWMRRLTAPKAKNGVFFSQLATVELEVALARKVAEGALSAGGRDRAVALFRRHLRDLYNTLPISDDVLQRARTLVRLPGLPHPLRTYDALHLATALTLADTLAAAKASPSTFVAADRKLLAIAQQLGLPTENPEDHP